MRGARRGISSKASPPICSTASPSSSTRCLRAGAMRSSEPPSSVVTSCSSSSWWRLPVLDIIDRSGGVGALVEAQAVRSRFDGGPRPNRLGRFAGFRAAAPLPDVRRRSPILGRDGRSSVRLARNRRRPHGLAAGLRLGRVPLGARGWRGVRPSLIRLQMQVPKSSRRSRRALRPLDAAGADDAGCAVRHWPLRPLRAGTWLLPQEAPVGRRPEFGNSPDGFRRRRESRGDCRRSRRRQPGARALPG